MKLKNKICDQVWWQVYKQSWDQVWIGFRGTVLDRVYNQVWDQVHIQVWNQTLQNIEKRSLK